MIRYPLEMVSGLNPDTTVLVVGHQADAVEKAVRGLRCEKVVQKERLGTAHAVKCAEKTLSNFSGDILVINGDTPLLSLETVSSLLDKHRRDKNSVTLLSLITERPFGLGRVSRDIDGQLLKIIEEKDASIEEKNIKEVSTGVYIFKSAFLFSALDKVSNNNAQGEYYLPDVVPEALEKGEKVGIMSASDQGEVLGVNNRVQLAEVSSILRKRILNNLMVEGVTIIEPNVTFVGPDVTIGRDTVLHPMVFLDGKTKLGSGCSIGPGTRIVDSVIADNVLVRSYSEIFETVVGDDVTIGPFAHLRPGTVLCKKAKVGNFVETKKTEIGEGSKVSHLSYIGDALLGKDVNIGAGTITCNYDGVNKHRTVIEDNVFVGSDTQIVAPVTLKKNSVVAAGSTVTKNVSEGALAISRAKQENRKGWADNWKLRNTKKTPAK